MSNFLDSKKFLVYQTSNDGLQWVPALFDHRDCCPYFMVAESLDDDLRRSMMDGTASGDAEPNDLRVVEVGTGDLYRLNEDGLGFSQVQRDGPHWSDADRNWFDYV